MLNDFNGLEIDFYESIDDLPIGRYSKFQRYVLMDADLGASIEEIVGHLNKVVKLIKIGNTEVAMKEVNSISESLSLVFAEEQPVNRAFACLVKKIDGKMWDDISDAGINKLINILERKRVKQSIVKAVVSKIKKNLKTNLRSFFRK